MRDFFARQDAARRKTGILVFYFICAVFLIVLTVCVTVSAILMYENVDAGAVWDPSLMTAVAGLTLLIITAGSYYKIFQLRGGGARIAEMMGGRLVAPNSTDLDERRLLNVVEEMSIASGVPVPPVYALGAEHGINAFAAGFAPDAAIIAVTEGALKRLNREEVQGVIAHEFSHILNGDMRLNIRLMGMLHGILIIALMGRSILRAAGRSGGSVGRSGRNRGGGGALIGLALLVIGYMGVFFANVIKSAVSRQREYLADASAVQFTRNPLGLAGALKKIGALGQGSKISNRHAEEASHMFFGNALAPSWTGLLETHPPIEERIHLLDPSFDGTFPAPPPKDLFSPEESAALQESVSAAVGKLSPGKRYAPGPVTADLIREIGAPVQAHMEAARLLIDTLPATLLAAVREPFGARAVVYGLLLDRDETVRSRQQAVLNENADANVLEELGRILPVVMTIPPDGRLPIIDLAASALRSLSPSQYQTFRVNVEALIQADDDLSIFEFTLGHVLLHRLDAAFAPRPRRQVQVFSLRGVPRECSCVLSTLARVGQEDEAEASAAFAQAGRRLAEAKVPVEFLPAESCTLAELGAALDRLAGVGLNAKRELVAACLQVLIHDAQVNTAEAELFRAVADALECPVPLWSTPSAIDHGRQESTGFE